MTLPMKLASWLNDRAPEMLWAVLIVNAFDRESALRGLRLVGGVVYKHGTTTRGDVSLSAIATYPPEIRLELLAVLCEPAPARRALRPLLLFDELPARADWAAAIGENANPDEDWNTLAAAIAEVADHQSQQATDVRWVRVLALLASGLLHAPPPLPEELLGYPDVGDQRKVRPMIRATEGSLASMREDEADATQKDAVAISPPVTPRTWATQFWAACFSATPCRPVSLQSTRTSAATTTRDVVRAAMESVAGHSQRTRVTSGVDARHEGAFGLAQYALMLLDESLSVGASTGLLGQIGLRALLECTLTFAYLAHKDDPTTWETYRRYGAGQAKLAFLKLVESSAPLPEFVNVDLLKTLANEDRWQDFETIDVGHWEGSNLRATSDQAGRKSEYDRYYPWTSAYVHGNWAAVRSVAYDLCANPLHRWHRVLRAFRASLDDVLPDACALVDLALETLDGLYPGGPVRITLHSAPT